MPEEKKGELYLEELGSHEWKAFWFVLDEGYLRYFASEGDLEPRAAIPCRGIVAKSVGKSRVGKHAFRLDVTKQEDGRYKYVLAGEEEVDSLEWLEALRDHGCHVNIDKIRVRCALPWLQFALTCRLSPILALTCRLSAQPQASLISCPPVPLETDCSPTAHRSS